jgi:site-specific recombinase XerD
MQEEGFRRYLKRKGKKQDVVERNVSTIRRIGSYLEKEFNINIQTVSSKEIDSFVETLEERGESAKGPLYVLMNYFRFTGDHALLTHAAELREERTNKTRKAFKLRGFLDVNQIYVEKLAGIGIEDVDQLLRKGKTKRQRKQLSEELQIRRRQS